MPHQRQFVPKSVNLANARARGIDVLDIGPLGGLGEIAKLGLTLVEAKQILHRRGPADPASRTKPCNRAHLRHFYDK
jgi:hypothetical protein